MAMKTAISKYLIEVEVTILAQFWPLPLKPTSTKTGQT